MFGRSILLSVSNLSLVPGIIRSFIYKKYYEAGILILTMIFSAFYHLCDYAPEVTPVWSECPVVSFEDWQFFDFTYSYYLIPIVILFLGNFPSSIEHIFYVLFLAVIMFCIKAQVDGVVLIISLFGSSILMVGLRYAIAVEIPDFDWWDFGFALGFSALGITFKIIGDKIPEDYWLFHTLWHIFIQLSVFFYFETLGHQWSVSDLFFWRKKVEESSGIHYTSYTS